MVSSHLETTMQLPSAPGALLGYRKNGRPIYLMAGGSTDTPPAPEPTPTPPAPEPPKPTPPAADPPKPDAERVEDLPDWAQKIVRDARKGEGDYRVKLKAAEDAAQKAAEDAVNALTEKLGKTLGIVKDDQPPSVDDLTAQLTAAQQQAQERDAALQQIRTERDVEKYARAHQGDPTALLDSKDFERALGKLDPADDGFQAALEALVKDQITANPKYQAGQAPASSSGDFSGGPGERPSKRSTSLHAAARDHYGVG